MVHFLYRPICAGQYVQTLCNCKFTLLRGSWDKACKLPRMTTTRLVVALDVPDYARATGLIEALAPLGVMFKIGYEAVYGFGDDIRQVLESRNADYMLDVKLHDIPRTVHAGMRALVRPGVKLVTIHALGGAEMLASAVEAAAERAAELAIDEPQMLAVTILTSIAEADLNELGLQGGPGEN